MNNKPESEHATQPALQAEPKRSVASLFSTIYCGLALLAGLLWMVGIENRIMEAMFYTTPIFILATPIAMIVGLIGTFSSQRGLDKFFCLLAAVLALLSIFWGGYIIRNLMDYKG